MRSDVIEAVGKYAGLAGFALGLVLVIFSRVIRLRLETVLPRTKAFQFYVLVVVLTWSLGVVGIGAWAVVNHKPGELAGQPDCSTQSGTTTVSGSGNITLSAGGCNTTINVPRK